MEFYNKVQEQRPRLMPSQFPHKQYLSHTPSALSPSVSFRISLHPHPPSNVFLSFVLFQELETESRTRRRDRSPTQSLILPRFPPHTPPGDDTASCASSSTRLPASTSIHTTSTISLFRLPLSYIPSPRPSLLPPNPTTPRP